MNGARARAAALGLLGILLFTALGIWQVERLGWKRRLIATVDARIHAPPVPAPGPAAWPAITADRDGYRRVAAAGTLLTGRDTLVQAVTELGPGFWVLTPLRASAGFTLLINRGFVPAGWREPARNLPAQVTGLLRPSEPGGGFLRRNDPAHDRWFSRDVAAIAARRGLGRVAPYFVDAERAPAGPPGAPVGGLTVVRFPDNHLAYALTWFALAALSTGWLILILRDQQRRA